MMVLLEHIFF